MKNWEEDLEKNGQPFATQGYSANGFRVDNLGDPIQLLILLGKRIAEQRELKSL